MASCNHHQRNSYSVTTQPFSRQCLLEDISPTIQGNGHLLESVNTYKVRGQFVSREQTLIEKYTVLPIYRLLSKKKKKTHNPSFVKK